MSDPRTVTVYGASDDLIEIEGAMSNTDVEKAVAWLRTMPRRDPCRCVAPRIGRVTEP